jgi:phage terminase large subunit
MITLHPKYKPLVKNKTRFFIVTGGRGSAKSFSVGSVLCLWTFESGHKILFTRQTMVSSHLSIIPEFQEKIGLLSAEQKFNVTKNEVTNLHSGSDIIFKGIKTSSGDQTAALKSLQGVTTWVLDEAEELTDENTFDKINLSIRQKGQQNRVILILNPTTKEHWIYKRFFEEAGVEPGFNGVKGDVTYIHTDYRDNIKHLDSSFIEQVQQMEATNPKKYQHTVLGGWLDKAEGVVYTNWKVGEYDTSYPTYYGQDYGFSVDPTTLVSAAIDKKQRRVFVKLHLYKAKLTTSQIAEENKQHAGRMPIYADSAEPRLIDELTRQGCNMRPAVKGPGSITAGIALLQDYELIIDPTSIELIKELNNYVWHDRKSSTPLDAYNHALDALRYAVTPQLQPKANFGFKKATR